MWQSRALLVDSVHALAAGTLSYGINMPCRTVVFVGDHVWLNSLQYRQMAGRAGRRGFDQLGHVAFLEVGWRVVVLRG